MPPEPEREAAARPEGFYHLLLRPDAPPIARPLAVARALAPVAGQHPTDLAIELRSGSGWLARNLEHERVDDYLRALRTVGCTPCVVSAEVLGLEPPARRVRRAWLVEDALDLEWAAERATIPCAAIRAIELIVTGKPLPVAESRRAWSEQARRRRARDPLTRAQDQMARHAELAGRSPCTPYREALARLELDQPRLLLAVGTKDPLAVYRFEPGTLLPEYPLLETHNALDCLLRFIEDLLAGSAAPWTLPAARRAWELRDFAAILHHRVDEVDRRLAWLHQVLAHGLWPGHPDVQGRPDVQSHPDVPGHPDVQSHPDVQGHPGVGEPPEESA